MIKSVRFLLIMVCLMAAFLIYPLQKIVADNDVTGKSDEETSGKLRNFSEPYKEDPKSDKSPKEKKESHKSSHNDDDDTDDDWDDDDDCDSIGDCIFDFFLDLFIDICEAIVTAPFKDFGYRYNSPPYNADKPITSTYVTYSEVDSEQSNRVAFQSRIYTQRVDKNIKSFGLYAKLLLPSGCAFDITDEQFIEKLNSGAHDSIDYSSVHLTVAGLTPDTIFNTEIGFGITLLTDVNGETHDSGSYLLRADVFPKEPLSIRFSADFSRPAGQRLTKLETTIGWHKGNWEIFTGYNSLINSDGQNLDGPLFGAAIWF